MKTRKNKQIQHHHFLMRLETKSCPLEADKEKTVVLINKLLNDIGMVKLDEPHVYYAKDPKCNEGLTAIVPITTSHVAFHFWRWPDKRILHNPASKCLLEFDIYTCGTLSKAQIKKVLKRLTEFGPTHLDATLVNRKMSMSIDSQMKWDSSDSSWESFCSP
jgi:S-adenosylmethionine/arginine decarboxylase-like enzyme